MEDAQGMSRAVTDTGVCALSPLPPPGTSAAPALASCSKGSAGSPGSSWGRDAALPAPPALLRQQHSAPACGGRRARKWMLVATRG